MLPFKDNETVPGRRFEPSGASQEVRKSQSSGKPLNIVEGLALHVDDVVRLSRTAFVGSGHIDTSECLRGSPG
jgi:hypothetical protein